MAKQRKTPDKFIDPERLRERMIAIGHPPTKEGGGQSWLARQVEMTPQGVQSILSGHSKRPKKLREIAAEVETTEAYLLSETDDPSPPGPRRVSMDELERPQLNGMPGMAVSTEGRRRGVPKDEIAHVDASYGAGLSAEAPQILFEENGQTIGAAQVLGTWRLPPVVRNKLTSAPLNHVHVVECEGRSMEPAVMDGDFVFIDETRRNPTMAGIFALWEGSGLTIRNVEVIVGSEPPKLRLIPENTTFSPYERLVEEVHIIGRYIGRFTSR